MGFRDRREPEGHAAGKDNRDFRYKSDRNGREARDKSERLHTAGRTPFYHYYPFYLVAIIPKKPFYPW